MLVNKAIAKGVVFQESCEVNDIISVNDESILFTSNGEISTKIVVIAEGATGKLARKLGFKPNLRVAGAVEYEHVGESSDNKLIIDFTQINNGYAWKFPKSTGVSFGLGAFIKGRNTKINLKKMLSGYLKQFSINKLEPDRLWGYPVKLYSGKSNLVKNNMLLVGEIAGCVNPFTAEGIRYSIKSGFIAATVIIEALTKNNVNELKKYNSEFHKQLGKKMVLSMFLGKNLYLLSKLISFESVIRKIIRKAL